MDSNTDTLISYTEKFLLEHYSDAIEISRYKKKPYLEIDFNILTQFDSEFADRLIDDFEQMTITFGLALERIYGKSVKPRFKNISSTLKKDIWKIRSKDVNKLIVIEGYVRRIAPIQHEIVSARFSCPSCDNTVNILMSDGIFKSPTKCSCGRTGKFTLVSKQIRDIQKLVVEDDPMLVKPPQKPGSIMVNLADDLCRIGIDKFLQPSKKVKITGMLKDRQVKPFLTACKKYIEANSIEILDETIRNIKFSQADIDQFKLISNSKTLYEDLAQSIIPNIEGHVTVKIAILLQLMGGEALYIDGLLEERGIIHILLISSPGQGKTVMLKRAIQFLYGSRFSSGRGSSGVGLIAAVIKDEEMGGWIIDVGAVPMASGSIIAIDEIEKMDKIDLAFLNNAMVELMVKIDKGNVHTLVETNTIILASANPKNRVFDKNELVWKQIGLPKDLLDRFDLIFPVQAGVSLEEKRKVAHLVVGKYREESKLAKPIYPHDFMVKYIAYARKNITPKLSKSVEEYIVENFINIVKPADPNEDSAYFSYRLLTNIIRLSQASTRARLSNEVEIQDAKLAINILLESLKAQDIITPEGLFDYERAEAIVPKDKRSVKFSLIKLVKSIQEADEHKLARYDLIKEQALNELEMDTAKLDEIIEKLRQEGDILEVTRGKYKVLE